MASPVKTSLKIPSGKKQQEQETKLHSKSQQESNTSGASPAPETLTRAKTASTSVSIPSLDLVGLKSSPVAAKMSAISKPDIPLAPKAKATHHGIKQTSLKQTVTSDSLTFSPHEKGDETSPLPKKATVNTFQSLFSYNLNDDISDEDDLDLEVMYKDLFSTRVNQKNQRMKSLRIEMYQEKCDLINELQPCSATTLAQLLDAHKVNSAVLSEKYAASDRLFKAIMGRIPSAHEYLEIYPSAFQAYNLIIPSFLNLPYMLWGILAADSHLIGLALYSGARASGCAYSVVHSTRFALKRGLSERVIKNADELSPDQLFPQELAVAKLASEMNSFPYQVPKATHDGFVTNVESESNREWIILTISLAAYMSTIMSALGLEIEEAAFEPVRDILQASGWSPGKHSIASSLSAHGSMSPQTSLKERSKSSSSSSSFAAIEKLKAEYEELERTQEKADANDKTVSRGDSLLSNLSLLRNVPANVASNLQIARGVPKSWPEVGKFLKHEVGHSFHVLRFLKHSRAIKAVATTIMISLDVMHSLIDPEIKYLIGLMYAGMTKNQHLESIFIKLAKKNAPDMRMETMEAVYRFALESTPDTEPYTRLQTSLAASCLSSKHQHMIYIAKACAIPSSKALSMFVIRAAKAYMTPAQTIEMISWLGVLAILHRLYIFYMPHESTNQDLLSVAIDASSIAIPHEPIMKSRQISGSDVTEEGRGSLEKSGNSVQ